MPNARSGSDACAAGRFPFRRVKVRDLCSCRAARCNSTCGSTSRRPVFGGRIVKSLNRFALLGCMTGAFAGLAFLVAEAHSQTYPVRPIRLMVPFPAGGGSDTMGALVGGMAA